MTTEIFLPESDAEIESCYPAFSALRPHVRREDFLSRVRRQEEQSYRILALRHEGSIPNAAGFRIVEFLAWGKCSTSTISRRSRKPAERGSRAPSSTGWSRTRRTGAATRCIWIPVTGGTPRTGSTWGGDSSSFAITWPWSSQNRSGNREGRRYPGESPSNAS